MAIEKKSLINTLKTTKKANVVASSDLNPKASNVTSKKMLVKRSVTSMRKAVSKRKFATKAAVDSFLKINL